MSSSLLGGPAHAEEPGVPSLDPQTGALHPVIEDDDPRDELAAFPILVHHEKHWFKASVELGGVVIIGLVDYLLHTAARGGLVREGDDRWALRYNWPELRAKLVGDAYELDGNRLATNYLSHPLAGTAYFHVARSNHLSFAESLLLSTIASSTWEYFGEIREKVSVNDMIVTPVAGAVIGEATMQLSGFFDRGRESTANGLLAFLFSPIKTVNYLTDGVAPERTTRLDALGLPRDPWHRFELGVGGGVTKQAGTSSTYSDLRFAIDTRLANLPGYRGAARHARLFDEGNVSRLGFRASYSGPGASAGAGAGAGGGQLVDALFETSVVPVGFYYREATVDPRGRLRGSGLLLGLRMGFEYGEHDFDRDRRRPRDRLSIVSPIGVLAEHIFDRDGFMLRTSVEVSGAISGVQPYALAEYRTKHAGAGDAMSGERGLPNAARNNGYTHAFGVTASPAIEASYGPVRAELAIRLDSLRTIHGLDDASDPEVAVTDKRNTARATLVWTPARFIRVSTTAERSARSGVVGDVHASRSETSLWGSLGVMF